MLSIKQGSCAKDIKVGWIDWMVITEGKINNGLTLNTCIGRGGSWAALLLGFCWSAAQWDRAASSSSLTPHWFTHPWNSHWGRRPPPLPYIWNEKCSWAPFLLMALSCLGFAQVFQKQVVVPHKRWKRDKFELQWVDAAGKYTKCLNCLLVRKSEWIVNQN